MPLHSCHCYTRKSDFDRLNIVRNQEKTMLYAVAMILIVLWILGLVTAYTMGGFIHILLVIAIVVVLLRVIQNRRI
jgi:low affinity Fe/Cu permease